MNTGIWLITLLALAPSQTPTGMEVPRDTFEFDPHLTGRGEKMNYGPFLAYSLISGEGKKVGSGKEAHWVVDPLLRKGEPETVILRAINIYLGGRFATAFDTEMCGFAAAWAGGFLNIGGANLNGYKGETLAYLRGPVLFQNAQTPGWSHDDKFLDPRKQCVGALPKEVVHYKGLYLHEGRTILSYSVGKSNVLDMPAMLVHEKSEVFCRTIHIDTLPEPRFLFVGDLPGGKGIVRDDGQVRIERAEVTLRVSQRGAPAGSEWILAGANRLALRLAPNKKPFSFKVFMGRDITAGKISDIAKASGPAEDLPSLCKGGPQLWKEAIIVKGKLGKDNAAYAVDTITLPEKNPWGAWMRPGGFDFFSDGRAALCTWNGDVWIASGLDAKLDRVEWRRIATGLFEPLGLRIVKDQIYVLGRDQITRLHLAGPDKEAHFYENFNNDGPTAASFHSFAMELHTDRAGNFYYSRGSHRVKEGTAMHGGVIKVTADGRKAELLCTGLREANGMSVGPDDTITVADNQGNNVPTSKIDIVRRGGWHGYPWGLKKPYPEPVGPLCWIPYKEDNSSGGQVWVTSKKWGLRVRSIQEPHEAGAKGDSWPLLHTSYGTSKLFRVFVQKDGDDYQGGVAAFPLEFSSGIMRARFNPVDGQLYVCGLKGWGSNAMDDGCFQRVRYTGKPVYLPESLRVRKNAIEISFTQPVDKSSAKNLKVEQWTYVWWSDDYGSKEYSIAKPGKVGRDPVTVRKVTFSEDGKTITLDLPSLRPVMQMAIHLPELRGADGTNMPTIIYNTINYVR